MAILRVSLLSGGKVVLKKLWFPCPKKIWNTLLPISWQLLYQTTVITGSALECKITILASLCRQLLVPIPRSFGIGLKFLDTYLHISESNLYFDLICGVDVFLIGLKNDVFVPSTPWVLEKNGLGATDTRNWISDRYISFRKEIAFSYQIEPFQ